MHWLSLGIALLVALAIIAIGTLYVLNPRRVTQSFGLPLPEDGSNVAWWLRLKGVRDIASGLTVLALMAWGLPLALGIVLFVEALIPIGDMLLILAAKGPARAALGIHGVTALVMVLASIPLMLGVP
ncbi:DUF4267 domain-containing protein [Bradyrhizobium sp. DOA1]|uniref:DUF4267 domain-containing protein n=1 Tax=Bradyrhizobium sp. DOA1 TaxID=1126616 RepID=UPI00077C67B4|nr:DUF4267 domain-containing protein [Bradyrhizobium sp. DOA1]KYH03147.1 hypothetical protein SE91_08955 [Bradyrhizobium sp. DOA1]